MLHCAPRPVRPVLAWMVGCCLLVALAGVYPAAQEVTKAIFARGLSPRTGLLLDDNTVVALIQNSSGDLARDTVQRLSLWDRSQVTEGYAQAAEWIASRAKEIGLQQVTTERFPSDGKTEYFGNGTQMRWVARKGELWITSPMEMKLTSFAEMPMSLAANSTTANVEAEIVDVGQGTPRDYPADVKGKIVLTTNVPSSVFYGAVMQRGAAGVISTWSVPDFDTRNRLPGDHPEQVGWGAIQPPVTGRPHGFAFLISARRGEELRRLLKQAPVRARAVVDAELQPGTLDVVSGVIPGTKYQDEEVVVSAHLDHYKPGANDNASGSAAILEMARTMRELIDAGRLAPPLRTVRFMWVPEYSGTRAWFATHLDDKTKRVAELNFDMVGENAKTTNAVFTVSYSPDANASFLNAVVESIVDFINRFNDDRYSGRPELQVLSLTGSRDRIPLRMSPYLTGTDHELFNSAGIPGTTLGVFPDDYYHSSGDSIEQVDATQLHRAVVFGLVGLTTIAYADDAQASDLAWLSLLYGRRRLADAESIATGSIMSASNDSFAQAEMAARSMLPHVYRREKTAVASCAVFARTPETRRRIEQAAAMIEQDQPAAQKRVEQVATVRAAALPAARATATASEADKRAARLVPTWVPGKRLTTIGPAMRTLAGDAATAQKIQGALVGAMNQMRARGESELRIMGLQNAPATWVDGTRSIFDIAQAMAVEYAPMPVDGLEAYFRALEKVGALKILEK